MIFTMLMTEWHEFYYANGFGGEVWFSFPSKLELASFGLSVIYILTPHPVGIGYTECEDGKQASE